MTLTRLFSATLVAAAAIASLPVDSSAQFTPVYFDGFDVSVNTNDINFETASREAGYIVNTFGTVPYVTSTADSTDDYRHQMFGPEGFQVLQLAEDGTNVPNGTPPVFSYKAMVSPDFNFTGTTPNGDVIGKRITVQLDVASYLRALDTNPNAPTFTNAGITIGGQGTLIDADDEINVQENLGGGSFVSSKHFSATFIEDVFAGLGSFMQAHEDGATVEDASGCIGCFLNHTGAEGFLNIDIRIDDPSDGNPWDGVGSTEIRVLVNGEQVTNPNDGSPWTHVIDNGGLTTNYITLYGSRQTFNAVDPLATHLFDNLTVFAAPVADVPGDYNYDGVTDAADYTVFRDNEGLVVDLPGLDPNALTPEIDQEDYDYWAANYGSPMGSSLSVSVPEPTAVALVIASLLAAPRRRIA